MGILDSIAEGLDDLLGLRDDLGVALKETWLVTHTWNGEGPGDGDKAVERERVLPSPRIMDFTQSLRVLQGGGVQQGDLVLRYVSKQSYPDRAIVERLSTDANIERFYEVGGLLYKVISITEDHLWWNVQLRPINRPRGA